MDQIDVFWSPRHHLPIFSSAPSVVTIHDLVWRKAADSMIPLGRTIEAILMPPSLRKADAIIAVSEATRRDLIEFQPDTEARTRVIPEAPFSGISAHEPTPSRGNFMLFVGTFEPRKNIPGILHAYSDLLASGITSHQLVLAGNPGWKSDVPGLISQLGLQSQVTVAGPLPQSELETLYRACDFVVQPSFYEGFGLPVVEALAFRKPVITSNLSAMPEVAGDAALLVTPDSVAEISAAMKRLITEPSLYDDLANKALTQAARFSWDRAAEDTLKVLEQVAERKG
jgi:glycosyltransferase involved in cell wall biosynthesis